MRTPPGAVRVKVCSLRSILTYCKKKLTKTFVIAWLRIKVWWKVVWGQNQNSRMRVNKTLSKVWKIITKPWKRDVHQWNLFLSVYFTLIQHSTYNVSRISFHSPHNQEFRFPHEYAEVIVFENNFLFLEMLFFVKYQLKSTKDKQFS